MTEVSAMTALAIVHSLQEMRTEEQEKEQPVRALKRVNNLFGKLGSGRAYQYDLHVEPFTSAILKAYKGENQRVYFIVVLESALPGPQHRAVFSITERARFDITIIEGSSSRWFNEFSDALDELELALWTDLFRPGTAVEFKRG